MKNIDKNFCFVGLEADQQTFSHDEVMAALKKVLLEHTKKEGRSIMEDLLIFLPQRLENNDFPLRSTINFDVANLFAQHGIKTALEYARTPETTIKEIMSGKKYKIPEWIQLFREKLIA